jgi:hypothetical protein
LKEAELILAYYKISPNEFMFVVVTVVVVVVVIWGERVFIHFFIILEYLEYFQ